MANTETIKNKKLKLTGRISFPHIFQLNDYEGKKSYSLTLLIEKSEAMDAYVDNLLDYFKNEIEAIGQRMPLGINVGRNESIFIRDGDNPLEFKQHKAEFKGHWVVKATNSLGKSGKVTQPYVLNSDGRPVTNDNDWEGYAGCYVEVSLNVWHNVSKSNNGLNSGFNAVKFIGHGEPLGHHVSLEDLDTWGDEFQAPAINMQNPQQFPTNDYYDGYDGYDGYDDYEI